MLKTRIILIVVSALLILAIFLLPKVVVDGDRQLASDSTISEQQAQEFHHSPPDEVNKSISRLRARYQAVTQKEKSAIFADSLASLYGTVGKFDSAGRFAEEAASFFNTPESWTKAGDFYYQAYTFSMDPKKQDQLAQKARGFYNKVLEANPANLSIKTKLAMTYLSSSDAMIGIRMLREVIAEDPQNEEALLNLGMLSIQSGQFDLAIKRLEDLIKANPKHVQGQLLLGVAYLNTGNKEGAKQQFEKVKDMDKDPSVQATVDSYLKDLK